MSSRSRRTLIVVLLLLVALIALLVFARCSPSPSVAPAKANQPVPPPPVAAKGVTPSPAAEPPPEVLTAATVEIPARVDAGATFSAKWTGPNNPGDYLTVVRRDAKPAAYDNYRETRHGATLELVAPMDSGEWEVRYVTVRSKTVLGRAPLIVAPVTATLRAPDEAGLGKPVAITWTGPDNKGDFICIVPPGASDDDVGNYADASRGSPLTIAAPVQPGEAEIRYVSGQGRKILARRKLIVTEPKITLEAASEVIAGAKFPVIWDGPKNSGDYLTIVPKGTPDGQYRNYSDVSNGSPLDLVAPMETGEAEIRYMTGTKARVLGRREIRVIAAAVKLDAPEQVVAGSSIAVNWTGPKNGGDYITVVLKGTPDGQYGNYADASKGSPLKITAPMQTGAAELRYMSGQGAKVLARRAIVIVPAEITLSAPAETPPSANVAVEWTGPNNAGDYLTIVPIGAKDGAAPRMTYTSSGSPAKVGAPKEAGASEIRYMSGQGNKVLARTPITVR